MVSKPYCSLSIDRRELLAAIGVLPPALASGCIDLPTFRNQAPSDLPPFKKGWAAVRQDGQIDVRLQFDGDIQQKIKNSGMSEKDLVGKENFDVSQESVQISGTPDVPAEQTVEGVVDDFVEVQSNWPGAEWYLTGLISLDEEVPLSSDPKFHVQFPSGYEYEFPTAQRRIDEGPVNVQREGDKILASYGKDGIYPRSRTIPFIDHYDYPALVWMRAYAEYRHRLLTKAIPVYDWDRYAEDAGEALRDGVTEITSYLAENTVTSIVTSGIPSNQVTTAATKFEDLQSVHSAFANDYEDFQSALKIINTLSVATQNETWMSVLTPDNGGLPRLQELSEIEWKNRNPVLTTAHDQERFLQQLNNYQSLINEQRNITQTILDERRFTDTGAFGGEEWRQLKLRAEQLVFQLNKQINEERLALEALKNEFR